MASSLAGVRDKCVHKLTDFCRYIAKRREMSRFFSPFYSIKGFI